MKPLRPDRRSRRTEDSLHVALNSLLLEKGYGAISVKDITARAKVGRSTFYEHHRSKDRLLVHGLEHLRAVLCAAPPRAEPLGFSRTFFAHVHEHRKIYRASTRGLQGAFVLRALKRIVRELVGRELGNRPHLAVPPDALGAFATDAFFSIVDWWFEHAPDRSPAEVDAIYRQLVVPAWAGSSRLPTL